MKSSLKIGEESGNCIHLTDVFSAEKRLTFYTDMVHVDDRGQEILANTIVKAFIPKVKSLLGERTTKDE
jgi:hypothetical protein